MRSLWVDAAPRDASYLALTPRDREGAKRFVGVGLRCDARSPSSLTVACEPPLAVRPEGVRVDAHGALLEKDGTVTAEIAADVVIWNPHVNKAKAMGDFDDDGWTAMACVEPGVVAADRPGIAPNGSLVLSQTIAPED